jgi:two-component system chemotaxis sensor kinase CheA
LARGKPAQGSILLEASHQGSNVVITVKDDGGGLNTEKILAKAKSKGLIPPDAQLSTAEIHELIFAPGFSTADTISDVSGRGVGMDVVRRNIHELGGRVDISSTPGKGSTFTIRLPLTLAILDGQVVRVGSQIFILPLVSIVESLKVQPKQLSTLVGKAELIRLRQDHIPIVRLHRVFNIEPDTHELAGRLLVIVEGDGQRVGLVVDDLLEQQQVVIKSLDTNYRRVGGVSGATILGDGTVALILDVAGVISLSRESKGDSWKISSPARTQP